MFLLIFMFVKMQYRQYNSKVELITKEGVKKRYPKLNVDDIVLASIGVDNEGWWVKLICLLGKKLQFFFVGKIFILWVTDLSVN